MSKGILFHSLRPHVENTLSPYDLVLDFGCKRSSKKNLNEVSWNDSGTEVIRPNTEGQEVNLYDQTSEHQFQNELPRSVAVEFFSDDIWVIHKKESYSNPI